MNKIKILIYFTIIFCGFFSAINFANAADYYVAINGDDANSGTIDQPWATPEKAWRNARAGDTVFFRAGTYTITSQIWTKYYGYNGTASSPIIFKNYNGENVIFSSSLSTVFRIERNYNYISGINFIGTAPTWFLVSYDLNVDGFKISDCTATLGSGGDNKGLVDFSTGANNVSIERCKIIGPGLMSQGVHGNTAGIIIFRATNVKILNNEITNVPIGIYYKHANTNEPTNIEIAYNFISNTDRHAIFLNSNYGNVHDNVIGPNNGGFTLTEANGVTGGNNNLITHNTVFSDFSIGCDDNLGLNNNIKDNIFLIASEYHRYCSTAHNSSLNYNLYPVGNAVYENRVIYGFDAWKIYYQSLAGHINDETYSLIGLPLFIGGSSPTTISGFTLAFNSPGKFVASDGKDMGADISLVGIQSIIAPDTTPPSSPTGLIVQ